MTIEQMIDKLRRDGWTVHHAAEDTAGRWFVRLVHFENERRSSGARGTTGMDRDCWREGRGPTLLAALAATGSNATTREDDLDLDAMLG